MVKWWNSLICKEGGAKSNLASKNTGSPASNTVNFLFCYFDTFMPIFGCQRYLANKKVNWMNPVGPSRAELSQVKMHVIHYLILLKFFLLHWYFYAHFWMSKVPSEQKSQLVDPCGTFMHVVYRRSKYMFFNDWYCWILNAVLILLMQLLIIIMFSLVIFIDGATK